jgi:hypothetical protein
MSLTEQKTGQIDDALLIRLMQELAETTNVTLHDDRMPWHFPTQCLCPMGSDVRYGLERDDLNPGGCLVQKTGKFKDPRIFESCHETAAKHGESVELYENTSLYVFLNKCPPDSFKKPKKYKSHPRAMSAGCLAIKGP